MTNTFMHGFRSKKSSTTESSRQFGQHINVTLLTSNLYGMGVGERVQAEGIGILSAQEVGPYVKLRVGVVNTQILDPGGESFVQPQVGPPLHGHLIIT